MSVDDGDGCHDGWGTELSVVRILTLLALTTSSVRRYYCCYPHSKDEEVEARGGLADGVTS